MKKKIGALAIVAALAMTLALALTACGALGTPGADGADGAPGRDGIDGASYLVTDLEVSVDGQTIEVTFDRPLTEADGFEIVIVRIEYQVPHLRWGIEVKEIVDCKDMLWEGAYGESVEDRYHAGWGDMDGISAGEIYQITISAFDYINSGNGDKILYPPVTVIITAEA